MEKEIDRIYTAVVNIELYKIKLNVKHNICPIWISLSSEMIYYDIRLCSNVHYFVKRNLQLLKTNNITR